MATEKKTAQQANRRQFLHGAAVATGGLAMAGGGSLQAATDKPTQKLNLQGYSIPLTPEGKASLVTPTPHHYGGQFIFVDYRADVKEVARFLPVPLEPEPTGRAFVIVNELFSVPDDNPDLIFTNPERTHYTEGVVAVRCSYRGTPGSYITAIWVSKDWSMTFGQFFGWPKKIANINMTRVPPLHPTLKPLGVGSRVRGTVAREGYRRLCGPPRAGRYAVAAGHRVAHYFRDGRGQRVHCYTDGRLPGKGNGTGQEKAERDA